MKRVVAEDLITDDIKNTMVNGVPNNIKNLITNIRLEYNNNISGEARQIGDTIFVSDKFISLPEDIKLQVFLHEIGHWYRENLVDLSRIMPWNSPFGNSALTNGNAEEDFAEAFSEFYLCPQEFSLKHPDLYSAIKEILEETL